VGAKSSLLVYTTGRPADLLRMPPLPDPDRTSALVAMAHPGWSRTSGAADGSLYDCIYPPDGLVCAGSFPGIDVLCDHDVAVDRPSELPIHLRGPGAGQRMILHAMHSVVDWFAYAIWDDGVLLRSLSLAPGSGVIEDIGSPQPFEAPFWAGEHPVIPVRGWPDPSPYPLPFHPLDLGEAALRELIGFVVEGRPSETDIDAAAVKLIEFTVTPAKPVTKAEVDEFIRTRKRRRYTLGPGGSLIPVQE
jgi:hypothetical protein